ncbi:MAG: amidinotransferase [Rhodospirillaceae bacterium]|nr:amidinotransferase [Rhodospirillaceae bacterium]
MFHSAAYGGAGWSPRNQTHRDEVGELWAPSGIDSEYAKLRSILLHRPGSELKNSQDPDTVQMLEPIELEVAQAEHDEMAKAFRDAGVQINYVSPNDAVAPNQMFCADQMFMTPEGAILARPASSVRAGEERWVARRLADIGIPILRTLGGRATFEGADAMWLDPETVVIGRGMRTNQEGAKKVAEVLEEIGVSSIICDMPFGTMHLMGMLRIVDVDLAVCWPRLTPHSIVEALRLRGTKILWVPDEPYSVLARALNFVTLRPRKILMLDGYEIMRDKLENAGVTCLTVEGTELIKAAGAIGCLTAILWRDKVGK